MKATGEDRRKKRKTTLGVIGSVTVKKGDAVHMELSEGGTTMGDRTNLRLPVLKLLLAPRVNAACPQCKLTLISGIFKGRREGLRGESQLHCNSARRTGRLDRLDDLSVSGGRRQLFLQSGDCTASDGHLTEPTRTTLTIEESEASISRELVAGGVKFSQSGIISQTSSRANMSAQHDILDSSYDSTAMFTRTSPSLLNSPAGSTKVSVRRLRGSRRTASRPTAAGPD